MFGMEKRISSQVVRDVVRIYLDQHQELTQCDIAERLDTPQRMFLRFLRMTHYNAKPEWEPRILELCRQIDFSKYKIQSKALMEVISTAQRSGVGERFEKALCKKCNLEMLNQHYADCTQDGIDLSLSIADENGEERWDFVYCRSDGAISDYDLERFTKYEPVSLRSHIIIVTTDEASFEDCSEAMQINDYFHHRVKSSTVMLLGNDCISREYTQGDLSLFLLCTTKRRSC